MKRIAVISASRADSGIYIPVIKALEREFNVSVKAWIDDSVLADVVPLDYRRQNHLCDVVMVLGDTMPMLQAAIFAAENNIPLAHIHGGDQTGSIDNKIRDAITAFADWHFPALPIHAERLKQMGVPEKRIKVVGPLGIYAMKDAEFILEEALRKTLRISDKPIILVIQHPVSSEWRQSGEQMCETIKAVLQYRDYEKLFFAPNGELGSDAMHNQILGYAQDARDRGDAIHFYANLPYLDFVSLLKYSAVIVGNSSCGLVEAPLFGVPCVNVGTRQGPRIGGLHWDTGYDREEVSTAIKCALGAKQAYRPYNPYAINVDGPEIIVRTIREEM